MFLGQQMKKKKKRVLMLMILVAIIIGGGYHLIKETSIGDLLFYDPYEYHYFCSPNGGNCLTVITYLPLNFVDQTYRRYLVFGKKNVKIPIRDNYIEFPEDTGLVVVWESDMKCKIISDAPPSKIMTLSQDIIIEIVSDNVQFHRFAEKYPDLRVRLAPKQRD
jgi:hypothetical protein